MGSANSGAPPSRSATALSSERPRSRSTVGSAVADRDGGAPLFALPTYTALLELRDLLAERGVARRWSE